MSEKRIAKLSMLGAISIYGLIGPEDFIWFQALLASSEYLREKLTQEQQDQVRGWLVAIKQAK